MEKANNCAILYEKRISSYCTTMYSIIKAKHDITLQHKVIFSELIWVMWSGLVQYPNDWQTWYKNPREITWATGLRFLPPFMGWASPNRKEVLSCHWKLQDSSFTSFNRRQEIRSRILGHLYVQIYQFLICHAVLFFNIDLYYHYVPSPSCVTTAKEVFSPTLLQETVSYSQC